MGTVRNVVDFGAFIDIGVKQDGLLHRSQIPRGSHLAAGDVVQVVDPEMLRSSEEESAWDGCGSKNQISVNIL